MIRLNNLSVKFNEHIVLDNISAEFVENKIYGIVGFNGAGKSTFFNSLSETIKPSSGAILRNGLNIIKKDVAYLETGNYFFSRITGNEYLKIFKQTNHNFNLSQLNNILNLPLDDLIETYSTGMRKKLALLGVLKQDKPIFILDEPFNGLDLETNKILELIVLSLKQKEKTVFISSHIIDPLISICDEIHILNKGKFTRKFEKNEFNTIEDELFGNLKIEAKEIISNSL